MSQNFGPFVQMGKLAQYMAQSYQMDCQLALQPLLAHFMEEVEVNIASDRFDHADFMNKLRRPLEIAAESASDPRRKAFLQGVANCVLERVEQTGSSRHIMSAVARPI